MLFLGYLYGIKSETKLAQQVNENIAFKWFLGLKLTEKGPDHATISLNQVRRFRDNNIAKKIFDNILKQYIDKKLVGGNILYTDSTHIKAKANKHRKTLVTVEKTPKEYISLHQKSPCPELQFMGFFDGLKRLPNRKTFFHLCATISGTSISCSVNPA